MEEYRSVPKMQSWIEKEFNVLISLQTLKNFLITTYLPSYSPQLNPVERFFEEIRKITANRIFKDGIDELSKILEEGIIKLKEDKSAIKSLYMLKF